MSLYALKATLQSKMFWVWQIAGVIIYTIPVTIRLVSGNVVLPILGLLENPWIDHFIPGNMAEKILVNGFFPGAAGAVAGEVFFTARKGGVAISRWRKYAYRLAGAMVYVALFSTFQLFGYIINYTASYGGNLFEYPGVYPINSLIAACSIFTPTLISYLKTQTTNSYHKLSRKR
jgi:hypothetical protein